MFGRTFLLIRSSKTWQFAKKMRKCYSTAQQLQHVEIDKIRNIGILAHIDAGKTTTTERMLFYAGLIHQMGEVHHGNTVTDYMSQERERGITITSAAVTLYWKNHQINLIDTPGHIDFTMEVEQTLNVLDGAVIILDSSAGVEAQTLTVWRQADRYKIPRIIYLNKLDRCDADIQMCCKSVETKLETLPLLLHLPVVENGKLVGIVDIISLELHSPACGSGKVIESTTLTETEHPKLWNEAKHARIKLVDKLTEYNDELANKVISSESLETVECVDIVKALRKVTFEQSAVPVLIGSSYKNIGVQRLMDAILLYLPAPNERNKHFGSFEDNLCARAFKILHDKQKGPLVFFRVYNCDISKNQKIYSIHQQLSEQTGRVYLAFADDFREVESIGNGNIAVVTGLKKIRSGDLVTHSQSSAQKAKNRIIEKMNKKDVVDQEDIDFLFGFGAKVPDPVFFCSIEPPSLAYQGALEQALLELQREDPSLRVTHNAETGQTVLGGMGELHIEIIKDRLLRDYKIDADVGPLQIAYREAPVKNLTDQLLIETKIGNSKQSVFVRLSLIPEDSKNIKDVLKLDKTSEAASNIAGIFPKHLVAIRQGIDIGLAHGPKISSPVVNVQVMLHMLEVGRGTSDTMIRAAVTQLVQKLLKDSGTEIMEPIMHLEVVVPEEHMSKVLADLSRRRTAVHSVNMRGNSKIIYSDTPLSELMGYSTMLRTITSGTATFTMEFNDYQKMSAVDEEKAIKRVRGF